MTVLLALLVHYLVNYLCPAPSLFRHPTQTVLMGPHVAVGSARDNDGTKISSSSSVPSRWWRADSQSSSAINADLRHYQWQLHQRRQQQVRVKSEEDNRKLWATWNGVQQEGEEEVVDEGNKKKNEREESTAAAKEETAESLSLLENLVHPEEELLDEINDRQIIQAVIASMAQWNLRKLQKMQRKLDQSRYGCRPNL